MAGAQRRDAYVPKVLRFISITLVLIHAGLVWNYLDPRVVPRPLIEGQVSVVRAIDGLGPTWVLLFAATGVAVAATLLFYPPCLRWAHAVGTATMTAYAFASWAGALLSRPPSPIAAAALATGVAAFHFIAAYYAARSVRPVR